MLFSVITFIMTFNCIITLSDQLLPTVTYHVHRTYKLNSISTISLKKVKHIMENNSKVEHIFLILHYSEYFYINILYYSNNKKLLIFHPRKNSYLITFKN